MFIFLIVFFNQFYKNYRQTLNSELYKLTDKKKLFIKKLDYISSKNSMLKLKLQTTCEQCRNEYEARRETLRIWELCVNQMAKRDSDYKQLIEVIKFLFNQLNKINLKYFNEFLLICTCIIHYLIFCNHNLNKS